MRVYSDEQDSADSELALLPGRVQLTKFAGLHA